jgi:hypothetical protein
MVARRQGDRHHRLPRREPACPDDHTEGEPRPGSSRTAVPRVLPRMAAGPKLTPRMNCGRAAARTTGLAGRVSFPMGSDTVPRASGGWAKLIPGAGAGSRVTARCHRRRSGPRATPSIRRSGHP